MRSSLTHVGLALLLGVATTIMARSQTAPKNVADAAAASPVSEASRADTSTPKARLNLQPSREDYVIGPDDLLSVDVWKEPEVTKVVPVRSDGKISLPLIGDVMASGQTPKQLEEDITGQLRAYLSDPEVTVIVQASRSRSFNVLGKVMRPGSFLLNKPTTVLDAIALAGGFRDFAKQTKIYVLRRRPDGTDTHLAFNYKQALKGKHPQQNVVLQANDTIVVP